MTHTKGIYDWQRASELADRLDSHITHMDVTSQAARLRSHRKIPVERKRVSKRGPGRHQYVYRVIPGTTWPPDDSDAPQHRHHLAICDNQVVVCAPGDYTRTVATVWATRQGVSIEEATDLATRIAELLDEDLEAQS